jgi:hypothetical protein
MLLGKQDFQRLLLKKRMSLNITRIIIKIQESLIDLCMANKV